MPSRRRGRVLRSYRGENGSRRELLTRPGARGSLLVIDRDAAPGRDERLIAHLGADEPAGNALLAALSYLAADPSSRACRALHARDAHRDPFPEPRLPTSPRAPEVVCTEATFRLLPIPAGMSIPALRWTRAGSAAPAAPVSLRDAIATAECYEPFRELTRAAIARHDGDPGISTCTLRAELARVLDSRIVLNRGLREAVLERLDAGEESLSEIAIRCGRVKRDSRGTTGETSWLARRIGLLPEGGQPQPTRWVHSDVLALIARDGLGIAPREVELG